ncbi:hypothetical protein EYZ11_012509 [Aspergillus tanneri]|nr:hypothetical protein EYZ11_012509 [Aspergillus tanneri]
MAIKDKLSDFRVASHLSEYQAPLPKTEVDLKVGVLIFTPSKKDVLLVQRAKSDSHANIWECPGGGVEQIGTEHTEADMSIIHAAVRECREETQLHISAFMGLIQDRWLKRGRTVHKFIFIVDVHESEEPQQLLDKVVLNPAEHQAFRWATRNEVVDMSEATFFPNQRGMILSAFDSLSSTP